jgi:hypothetical protein
MNIRRLIIPLMFLVALEMRGQERLLIGPTLGYEFSVPLLLQRSEGAINYEYGFEGTGESYSHTAIVGGQLIAPRAWSELLGFSTRIALHATTGNFTSNNFVPGIDLDTAQLAAIDSTRYRYMEVDMTAALLAVDAQLRLSLGETMIAGAGLWTSYRLSAQFLRTERPLIVPPDIDPEDATIVTGGDRIASNAFGYGAVFSIAAQLPLNARTTIVPEITSRLDAIAMRRGMGFQSFTIGAGVSLLFDGIDAPPPIIAAADPRANDPSPRDTRPAEPRLAARVDLFTEGAGDRTAPAMVETEEVVNRVLMTVPQVVPFERNAFEIPGGYARLSREQAQRFTMRSLAGIDIGAHYRHLLNILGLRMRDSDASRLTITGVASVDEPPSLARVRAEVIRDYLVSVWGISASRITVVAQQGSMPHVRVDGTPTLFTTPVLSQWRARRYRMPQVGLDRAIIADAGMRRWTLELTHGGRALGRYDSDSSAEEPTLDLRFLAGGDSAASIPPIIATLSVEDSLGRTTTATDELRVQRATERAVVTGRERVELVAFDHGLDTASASLARRTAARRAARLLRDGAIVSVGLTGDATRRDRSLDVARTAEELLAEANARGIHVERYVVDREEGARALPNGVRITIDQSRDNRADEQDAE